eukprot:3306188-Lingulodinium_polyedra.AAC.1
MGENVVGMPAGDRLQISEALGVAPVAVEALDVGRVRRPRLYWPVGFAILPAPDLVVTEGTG